MVGEGEAEGGGAMKPQKVEFVRTDGLEQCVFEAYPHWRVLSITPYKSKLRGQLWAVLMEKT